MKKARVGCADSKDFDSATYFLAHTVMADTGARTGALVNLHLAEWEDSRSVKGTTVITIHDHKTGLLGTAKLNRTPFLRDRMEEYVANIRPHLPIEGRR